MSGRSEAGFQVRLLGQEVGVDDLAALVELARTGQIGAATEVHTPDRGWVEASEVRELAVHFEGADPWAAWDAMEDSLPSTSSSAPEEAPENSDEVPGAALRRSRPRVAPPPDDPDLTDPGIPTTRRRKKPEVEVLPDSHVHDVTTGERSVPHELRPPTQKGPERVGGQPVLDDRRASPPGAPFQRGGKVLAFPSGARASVQGANALQARDPVPVSAPPRSPRPRSGQEEPTRKMNWTLPVLALCGGLIALLGHRIYVDATAGSTYQVAPPVPTGPVTPGGDDLAGPPEITPPSEPAVRAPTPVVAVEDELRGQLMDGIRDVAKPGDLDDALLIELLRVKLDVSGTDAKVMTWGGRKQDAPQLASVRVRLRSDPAQLDRELGGVALVVGKYVQFYRLELESLEVELERPDGTHRVGLDASMAAELYLQRTSLEKYLAHGLVARQPD